MNLDRTQNAGRNLPEDVEAHPRIRAALVSVDPSSKRPAWHGAPTLIGLLRGVDYRVASFRPRPDMNNIREIALHVAFWDNRVANRLSGEVVRLAFKQRTAGWAMRLKAVPAEQWESEVRMVIAAHQRLVAALTAFDPAMLDKPFDDESKRPAVEMIHGVGEHALYHAAQVKMLKLLARPRLIRRDR